jgi:hypothetical protein
MLTLPLIMGCLAAEGDPPDARVPSTDGAIVDAVPFQIPDAAPRIDAAPQIDAAVDAAPE